MEFRQQHNSCVALFALFASVVLTQFESTNAFIDFGNGGGLRFFNPDKPHETLAQNISLDSVKQLRDSKELCRCASLKCVCCVGFEVVAFKVDRKSCFTVKYLEVDRQLLVYVESPQYRSYKQMSTDLPTPPPFCFPITLPPPIPPIPIGMEMCVKVFDVNTQAYNLHFCMDMEAKIFGTPIVIFHFDCLLMGESGVSFQRPDGTPIGTTATAMTSTADVTASPGAGNNEIFDVVTEAKKNANDTGYVYVKPDDIMWDN